MFYINILHRSSFFMFLSFVDVFLHIIKVIGLPVLCFAFDINFVSSNLVCKLYVYLIK